MYFKFSKFTHGSLLETLFTIHILIWSSTFLKLRQLELSMLLPTTQAKTFAIIVKKHTEEGPKVYQYSGH